MYACRDCNGFSPVVLVIKLTYCAAMLCHYFEIKMIENNKVMYLSLSIISVAFY